MSQRSSPRSPRSKSSSCHKENELAEPESASRGRVIDEMQRRLEEELQNSERFLNAASSILTEHKGSRNYSRPQSVPGGSLSRIGSPLLTSSRLSASYNNEMHHLQLPTPPQTLSGQESRGVTPGVSQRVSTRLPTPEFSRSKSRAGSAFLGTKADSTFGTSVPGCSEAPEDPYETGYLDMATSHHGSKDWRTRGPSEVTGASNLNSVHFGSSRQQSATCPASRETVAAASGTGYSTSTGTMSGLTCAKQRPESYVTAGSLGPGVDAMSRNQFSYKEDNRSEQSCRAGCGRYPADEVEKPSVALGMTENLRQRSGQPICSHECRQAVPENLGHTSGHGIGFARSYTGHEPMVKGPQMPSTAHMHHHHHDRRLQDEPGRDDRTRAALAHLGQVKKTPSYVMCGVNQSVDLLSVSNPRERKIAKLPERPCLQQEELAELIKCERQDVESAWYLVSEQKKTYKKPCPKQQKAQMSVRAIVKTHESQTCGEKYIPLEHPDPEDISPEVAASMMFSQEQGIRMDGCPKQTILHLFPDDYKQPFPEKIPRSSISVVDPNQKDQEELIEKSAAVPSEGVSDSAYTRTMKEKGEDLMAQKSYDVDFAIGQSKREYILVAQKPQRFSKIQFRGGNLPPWFPGYFSAFPDEDGGLKSIPSPSGLFHKAWFHANPRNMPSNDVIVLD